MKKETAIFFTALMFYTRIPCPRWITHDPVYVNKATRYLPLIGWITGGISALVWCGAMYVFNPPVAIVLSIVAGILVTGAFHEDGFADVCDGFGGGWTKEKILLIMKDSRVGAYGAIGIVLMLLLKYAGLSTLPEAALWKVMIAAHSFSRLCPVIIIATARYVREHEEEAKAKPLAKAVTAREIIPAIVSGLLPLLFFPSVNILLALLLPLAATLYLRRYFKKWIGGYTGDCLGATQQVTEVLFYLSCIALWKFT